MKVSPFIFNIALGLVSTLSLSQAASTPVNAEHENHAECEHDHQAEEAQHNHEHKEGESCPGDHDHKNEAQSEGEHQHKEGETCTGDHEEKEEAPCTGDHDHAGESKSACSGGEGVVSVNIDDKARNSLDLKVEKVVARPGLASKSFYGQMEIPPHAVNTYALPTAGRVKLNVQSAQHVKKGDLLYTLDSPELLEMKGSADESKAALDRNKIELDTLINRQKQLEEIGTKNSELETNIKFKQAERPGLEAAAENASRKLAQALEGAELKNGTLYVKADKDGSIQSVDMTRGAWGDQGATVLVLTNKGQLEFKSTAYSADALDPAQARLVLDSPDGKESLILNGHLRISDQINKDNQTRNIYFVPANLPEGTFAGQVAKLELASSADQEDGYIPVPNSAVVKVGINDVVFIQDADHPNTFIMKKVSIMSPRQGMTPVKGLVEGQTIVTKGGYELKYAIPAQGGGEKKAAGHFHADGKFHEGEH